MEHRYPWASQITFERPDGWCYQKGHTENITEIENVKDIVEQYRTSCVLAMDAGFDGIELLSQG
jgi:NADH:flavin oxidoreductases, Old Yellow Enzyme family